MLTMKDSSEDTSFVSDLTSLLAYFLFFETFLAVLLGYDLSEIGGVTILVVGGLTKLGDWSKVGG